MIYKGEERKKLDAILSPPLDRCSSGAVVEDRDNYLQFMDRYLKAYQENNGYIREPDEL